jgi:hypothetical protein
LGLALAGCLSGRVASAAESPVTNVNVTGAAGGTVRPARFPLAAEALGLMFQVMSKLQEHVRTRDLVSIHTEDVILQAGLGALGQQAPHVPSERRDAFKKDVAEYGQHVGALHLAADMGQQQESEKELRHVETAFDQLTAYFPKSIVDSARMTAEFFTCPSHPDKQGKRQALCPKCGQPLDQPIRLLPEFCGFPMSSGPSINATVRTDRPLKIGEPVKAVLQLIRSSNGAPVYPSDLIVTHTERVHLLVVDSSLSDYHHEHPHHTRVPGEYAFSFTPRRLGPYRVWADLRPQPMGLQEYAAALIPAGSTSTHPDPVDRTVTNRVVADGFTFELILPAGPLRFARPNLVQLRMTDADGTPLTRLEPFMTAYAHLVGFYEDGRGVVHVHPKGPAIYDRNARGGPELEFQFYTTQRGFVRLFAQVQINGESRYAPFGIFIGP